MDGRGRRPPRVKDDEAELDRIAGEIGDLLAGFPMPGWGSPTA